MRGSSPAALAVVVGALLISPSLHAARLGVLTFEQRLPTRFGPVDVEVLLRTRTLIGTGADGGRYCDMAWRIKRADLGVDYRDVPKDVAQEIRLYGVRVAYLVTLDGRTPAKVDVPGTGARDEVAIVCDPGALGPPLDTSVAELAKRPLDELDPLVSTAPVYDAPAAATFVLEDSLPRGAADALDDASLRYHDPKGAPWASWNALATRMVAYKLDLTAVERWAAESYLALLLEDRAEEMAARKERLRAELGENPDFWSRLEDPRTVEEREHDERMARAEGDARGRIHKSIWKRKEVDDARRAEAEEMKGTITVPSREAKIFVIDFNTVQDDYYSLYLNEEYVGPVRASAGGRVEHPVRLASRLNVVELRLTEKKGAGTKLLFHLEPGGFEREIVGSHGHVFLVTAP